jgi:hypothetical protein
MKPAAFILVVVVCGLFFLVGVVLSVQIVRTRIWPEWQANHHFLEARCEVLDKRLGESSAKYPVFRPEIHIRYAVAGQVYQTWTYDVAGAFSRGRKSQAEILEQFPIGTEHPCWYDPDEPSTAVLVRGYNWTDYLLSLFVSFVFMGSGGAGLITYGREYAHGSALRTA